MTNVDFSNCAHGFSKLKDFSNLIFKQQNIKDVFNCIESFINKCLEIPTYNFYLKNENELNVVLSNNEKNYNSKILLDSINTVSSVAKGKLPEMANNFSELVLPLMVNDLVYGVLFLKSSQQYFFESYHKNLLENVVNLSGIKIEFLQKNKLQSEKIERTTYSLMKKSETLNSAINQIKSSKTQMEDMLYYISHDLKEPVRNMNSFLGLIERAIEKEEFDKVSEYIKYVNEGSHRLTNMIDEVYKYSVLNTKSFELSIFDLNNLMEIVKEKLKEEISKYNAEIIVNQSFMICNQQYLLCIVLQNLVKNAINFCEEEFPKIVVSTIELDDKIKFIVADNGVGVEEENNKTVFELFKRFSKGKTKGSGIGLATCKKIVESLGGKIWVESKKEKGSEFHFTVQKQKLKSKNEKKESASEKIEL